MSKTLDTETIRQAAQGNWPAILSTLGGVPIELLDGKHHPCPKCGGDDRFRIIDQADGAVMCNQCFNKQNGDGFAALQWLLGIKFPEAVKRVAEHLGIAASKANDPAKDLKFQPWSSELVRFFTRAKPGVTEEALLAAGARLAKYKRSYTVIALPIIGQKLDTNKPVGWIIANYNGNPLPKWNRDGEIVGQVKLKITYGSKPGLVGAHAIDRLKTEGMAELVWKVEGVSDLLALWSAIPEQLRDRHLVVTNANGAGETPRWPATLLASHDTNIIHDADQPGQAGAAEWSRAVAAQSTKTVRNVQLPYSVDEKSGKDIRDWLAESHKYGDLLDLAEQSQPVAVKKTASGEVDYEAAKFPVQELILKKLQLEVVYENAMGHIRVFSTGGGVRKSSWIKSISRCTEEDLIQICGPPAMFHISSDPDGENTWSVKDIRKAITIVSHKNRGNKDERGVGVWQGIDERGNETESIVLVNDTEAARWNGDQVLRRILSPRADGLVMDFDGGHDDWYDFDALEKYFQSAADLGWRKSVIDETRKLFNRWRWQNQEIAPTLVTGLVMASWVQTVWTWRPIVAVSGESHSGKSFLFEALGGSLSRRGIFGGLAFRQSKSTEAGFRQGIGNTGRVALNDEFESGKERDKIQELLRASTRGETIARGTTDQRGRQTTLRHIAWTASVETGGKRQPDINRMIRFELLPAVKGQHGKLTLDEGSYLETLGQKLLAIAVRSANRAKQLADELKGVQAPGIDARTVEGYGVPTAMLAVAMDYDSSQAESLLFDLLGFVEKEEQGMTDQEEVLEAILTASINLGPPAGVRTVGQVLESDSLFYDHSARLEAAGVKPVDGGLFIHRNTVTRQLLKGTEWERQRIDQILMRIPGAHAAARRLSGKPLRGIFVPAPDYRGGESEVAQSVTF